LAIADGARIVARLVATGVGGAVTTSDIATAGIRLTTGTATGSSAADASGWATHGAAESSNWWPRAARTVTGDDTTVPLAVLVRPSCAVRTYPGCAVTGAVHLPGP